MNHHPHARPAALDLGARRDAVAARHADIQDHQIGREALDAFDGLLTVRGLANHLETGVRRQQRAYRAPRALPIVRDQQADWCWLHGTFSVAHSRLPRIGRMQGFARPRVRHLSDFAHPLGEGIDADVRRPYSLDGHPLPRG